MNRLNCYSNANQQVDCQFEQTFLGLIALNQQTLPGVYKAELREDCTDTCVYWIDLQSETGIISLTNFGRYHQSSVEAEQKHIQAYLNKPVLSPFVYQTKPSWVLIICGIPLLVGGLGGMSGYFKKLKDGS